MNDVLDNISMQHTCRRTFDGAQGLGGKGRMYVTITETLPPPRPPAASGAEQSCQILCQRGAVARQKGIAIHPSP